MIVPAGNAHEWTAVRRFWVERPAGDGGRFWEVEHSRAYRDRLVVKLRGVEDGNAAALLRGCRLFVAEADAPDLPVGTFYAAQLVGLRVVDEAGRELGVVEDVVPTGGADLLRVQGSAGTSEVGELLIPMAREFVLAVEREEGRIRVRLPEGLEGTRTR